MTPLFLYTFIHGVDPMAEAEAELPSGRLTLRLSPETHARLIEIAQARGSSVNGLIGEVVDEFLAAQTTPLPGSPVSGRIVFGTTPEMHSRLNAVADGLGIDLASLIGSILIAGLPEYQRLAVSIRSRAEEIAKKWHGSAIAGTPVRISVRDAVIAMRRLRMSDADIGRCLDMGPELVRLIVANDDADIERSMAAMGLAGVDEPLGPDESDDKTNQPSTEDKHHAKKKKRPR